MYTRASTHVHEYTHDQCIIFPTGGDDFFRFSHVERERERERDFFRYTIIKINNKKNDETRGIKEEWDKKEKKSKMKVQDSKGGKSVFIERRTEK